MLGTWNVPNGDGIASPPPSFSRSGWLGTAWQEEQPPALNVVTPLARFGVRGASEAGATTAGTVNHQKMPAPAAPARIKTRKIRRSIQRSVIREPPPDVQYGRTLRQMLPRNFRRLNGFRE